MIKEIPILYSTMMAKAKVEKRKTQTRRVMNPQPADHLTFSAMILNGSMARFYNKGSDKLEIGNGVYDFKNPYGQPGDLLYCREAWCDSVPDHGYLYKADFGPEPVDWNWKPSLHMPKVAARIWDEVIRIRVERVADISEADCIAEGILFYDDKVLGRRYKDYEIAADGYGHPDHDYPSFDNAYASYRSLWQMINGEPKLTKDGYIVYPFNAECSKHFEGLTTWKGKPLTVVVNPWVWVIETKQLSVTGKPSSETDAVHRY